ncbi:scavenger receptor cysteine-rich protein-like protein [Leptotrombidium deliense]|uniref:Scavenger receptor cysteine-rich protein-like protein n=1 Tax=Leptotrombidium deliense TaxID=299467 RepID=A0A443S0C6_9ACAR|nr:scavenger receptor cysteine-rich protein-like protein [Leptotrombidium deliense]
MKLTGLLFFWTIVIVSARIAKPRKCVKNEMSTTGSSLCEYTCGFVRRRGVDFKSKCPKIIRAGCKCKPGFARNRKRQCVEKAKCMRPKRKVPKKPKECDNNEVWAYNGARCQKTCNNVRNNIKRVCPKVADPGCICKNGYAANKYGVCVEESSCFCEENEEWTSISKCEKTCEHVRTEEQPVCDDMEDDVCTCRDGFVRGDNAKCVQESECYD